MTVMAEGELKDVTLREFAMLHVALIASAGVVVFATVRVYFVAGSIPNAYEVVRSLGPAQIVSASLIGTVPLMASALFLYAVAKTGLSMMSIALAALMVAVIPPVGLLIVVYFLFRILRFRHQRQTEPRRQRSSFSEVAPFLILGVLVSLLPVWLSTETVEMADKKVVVGYVIEADEAGFMSVLTFKDRRLVRLRTSDVRDRQLCNPYHGWLSRDAWYLVPLIWHAFDGEPPDCPSD